MQENLSLGFVNNIGTDQTERLRSLISAFDFQLFKSIKSILAMIEISIFQLISVAEQIGLNLSLSESPKTGFGSFVDDSMLIVAPIERFSNCSMFCYGLLCVHSSFAIILMGKRENWLLCLVCFPGVS